MLRFVALWLVATARPAAATVPTRAFCCDPATATFSRAKHAAAASNSPVMRDNSPRVAGELNSTAQQKTTMSDHSKAFADAAAIEHYAEGARRNVPGHAALLTMTRLILAERVPAAGRVLVVGAGGGLELEEFAKAHADWQFEGVDPSAAMLDLAARRLGPALAPRVKLVEGFVENASDAPLFDAATCLLTFHFVARDKRVPMLREILRRLAPGAPLVSAHFSIEDGPGERDVWMSRFAAHMVASGVDAEKAAMARERLPRELPILTPAEDEALLREAGFTRVQMFYTAFTFRGWVAYA